MVLTEREETRRKRMASLKAGGGVDIRKYRPAPQLYREFVADFTRYLRRFTDEYIRQRIAFCVAGLQRIAAADDPDDPRERRCKLDYAVELEAGRRLLADRRRWRDSGRESLRISDDEIAEIKSRLPIENALDRLGVEHRRGRFRCLNPEHADSHPSASIHPRDNYVHCFACGWSGDVIAIVALAESLSFRDAIERCRAMIGGVG